MPQEFLHDPQVSSILEKVAREGMAQHVRADPVGSKAGGCGDSLEIPREGLAGERAGRAD